MFDKDVKALKKKHVDLRLLIKPIQAIMNNDRTLLDTKYRDQLNELDNQMGDLINRRDDIINHLLDRCEPIRNIVENSGLSRQRIHVIRNREGQ